MQTESAAESLEGKAEGQDGTRRSVRCMDEEDVPPPSSPLRLIT